MAYVNTELGYVVTKPNNVYAQLDTYNNDSIIGPPVSPIIPSMNYIQLPRDYTNYGYNSLSHDFDGNGYYNVMNGYGKKCTTFDMAKCPRNQIITPVGAGPAPAGYPAPAVREGFDNTKNTVRDLSLYIYVDDKNCPHCHTLKKLLIDNGLANDVILKDINDPAVKDELLKIGGTGVPFTVSKKLGTSVTGAPPSINALVKSLTSESPASREHDIYDTIRDLQLTVYTSPDCAACAVYKQFIDQNGLRPYIKIVDVTNKDDVDNDVFLKTNSLPAYPFTYSRKYKTSFPGAARHVKEIINLLTNQGT